MLHFTSIFIYFMSTYMLNSLWLERSPRIISFSLLQDLCHFLGVIEDLSGSSASTQLFGLASIFFQISTSSFSESIQSTFFP